MRAVACAAALVASVMPATEREVVQQPTFSSRAEAVRVDVSVTERGRPVRGLTAADFDIFDNGVRQRIELLVSEDIPIDLVMALDMSISVTGERLEHLRKASRVAVQALAREDRAALITFSQRAWLRVPLNGDRHAIDAALNRAVSPGGTSMIDATYAALAHADSGRGRALAIVLSDGVDTASWLTAELVSEAAKRMDAVLFGVSTHARDRTVLEGLAAATGGDVIRLESTAQLATAIGSLIDAFRQRYVLSFVPQSVARSGWHKLEVRTKRRGTAVKARAGYFGS